jgi:hypothetical protein
MTQKIAARCTSPAATSSIELTEMYRFQALILLMRACEFPIRDIVLLIFVLVFVNNMCNCLIVIVEIIDEFVIVDTIDQNCTKK